MVSGTPALLCDCCTISKPASWYSMAAGAPVTFQSYFRCWEKWGEQERHGSSLSVNAPSKKLHTSLLHTLLELGCMATSCSKEGCDIFLLRINKIWNKKRANSGEVSYLVLLHLDNFRLFWMKREENKELRVLTNSMVKWWITTKEEVRPRGGWWMEGKGGWNSLNDLMKSKRRCCQHYWENFMNSSLRWRLCKNLTWDLKISKLE